MKELSKKLIALVLADKHILAGEFEKEDGKKVAYGKSYKMFYLPIGSIEVQKAKVMETSEKQVQSVLDDASYASLVEITFNGKQIASVQVLENLLENYAGEDLQ